MAKGWTRNQKILAISLLIILSVAVIGLIETRYDVNYVNKYVASLGYWAPAAILVMIIFASSVGFIFQIPVAVAGILLDLKLAFVVSVLGLSAGATISFWVARYLGRDYIEKRYVLKISSLKKYDLNLKKHGFWTILFLRLIAIIPYEAINIAGGLSRVSFSRFIAATIIGIMPGTLIALYFAKTATNIFSLEFIVASLINIGFAVLPLLFRRVRTIVLTGG